jgi:hypothetical protein
MKAPQHQDKKTANPNHKGAGQAQLRRPSSRGNGSSEKSSTMTKTENAEDRSVPLTIHEMLVWQWFG